MRNPGTPGEPGEPGEPRGYNSRARRAAIRLAVENRLFSTDDIWMAPEMEGVPIGLSQGRWMGTIMRELHREQILEMTPDFEPSVLAVCHHRPKRVWRSLIHGDRSYLRRSR